MSLKTNINDIDSKILEGVISYTHLDDLGKNIEVYREKLILILRVLAWFENKKLNTLRKNLFYYYLRPYELDFQTTVLIDGFYQTIAAFFRNIQENKSELENKIKNSDSKGSKLLDFIKDEMDTQLNLLIKIFGDSMLFKESLNVHLENLSFQFSLENFIFLEKLRALAIKEIYVLKILKNKLLKEEHRQIVEDTLTFLVYILTNISNGKVLLVELSSFIIYIYKILDHFIQGKNIQEITSLEISDIENLIVSLENLNKTTQIEKWAKILRSRLEWKPVLENYYYLQVNFYNLSTPTRGKIKAIFYSLRNLVISSIIVGIIVKLLQNFQFIR